MPLNIRHRENTSQVVTQQSILDKYKKSLSNPHIPESAKGTIKNKITQIEKDIESNELIDVWELIDGNENVIISFNELLQADQITNVDELMSGLYDVSYYDYLDREVRALVSSAGSIIIDPIIDYGKVIDDLFIRIWQYGYMIDDFILPVKSNETVYNSIIDLHGNYIVKPSLASEIKYDSRAKHFIVDDRILFDLEGNIISKNK